MIRITKLTDFDGREVVYSYDGKGDLISAALSSPVRRLRTSRVAAPKNTAISAATEGPRRS